MLGPSWSDHSVTVLSGIKNRQEDDQAVFFIDTAGRKVYWGVSAQEQAEGGLEGVFLL